MSIQSTQKYTIEKSAGGYTVRRHIYSGGLMSAPVEIQLPAQVLSRKYKNHDAYCRAINRLIDAELDRIASEKFNGR